MLFLPCTRSLAGLVLISSFKGPVGTLGRSVGTLGRSGRNRAGTLRMHLPIEFDLIKGIPHVRTNFRQLQNSFHLIAVALLTAHALQRFASTKHSGRCLLPCGKYVVASSCFCKPPGQICLLTVHLNACT